MAGRYYELLALDNQLDVVRRTIGLQKSALKVVNPEAGCEVHRTGCRNLKPEVLNSHSNLEHPAKDPGKQKSRNQFPRRPLSPTVEQENRTSDQLPPVVSVPVSLHVYWKTGLISAAELDLTAAENWM